MDMRHQGLLRQENDAKQGVFIVTLPPMNYVRYVGGLIGQTVMLSTASKWPFENDSASNGRKSLERRMGFSVFPVLWPVWIVPG